MEMVIGPRTSEVEPLSAYVLCEARYKSSVTVPAKARVMRCSVLTWRICLQVERMALRDTPPQKIAKVASLLRVPYALSGTDLAYAATSPFPSACL
eukprot:1600921-Rhodomonas_salina.3